MLALDESRAWCAATMRSHAKSFYLATRVLPRRKREAIEAVYAFCRDVDDTVDLPHLAADERCAKLDRCRNAIPGLADPRGTSEEPWYPALRDAYRCFNMEHVELQRLIYGCERDLLHVNLRTMEELEQYAALVAGSVGRCILPILGARDRDSLRLAELLGIAMQLTNVLRDVREDALNGRNYLPLAEIRPHNPSHVMRLVAQRARAYYRLCRTLPLRVPNDGSRAAILSAAALYERILDRVCERGFDPDAERAVVGTFSKARLFATSVFSAYTGFATIR